MFKITAVISLLLIGSTLWAASLSCDSCGSECASACGTRHFRSCCFNYLRKKRGQESFRFLPHSYHDWKPEVDQRSDDEPWIFPGDFKLYPFDDTFENRLQTYN